MKNYNTRPPYCSCRLQIPGSCLLLWHIVVVIVPETRPKDPVRTHEKEYGNGRRVPVLVLFTRFVKFRLQGKNMGNATRSMVQRFNGHGFEILNFISLCVHYRCQLWYRLRQEQKRVSWVGRYGRMHWR
jgi:hypothetical protein